MPVTVSQDVIDILVGSRESYRHTAQNAEAQRATSEAERDTANRRADELDAVIDSLTLSGQ